ncbi:MAG: hypothetical protein HKN31_00150 [Pricia sp.]|nr:hypothetical protein [Pricia sp.]
MKAHATLKNVDSDACKPIILRNLSRILDIRIIDIDTENGILHFFYYGRKALEQVKNELGRIGYPVQNCHEESPRTKESITRRNFDNAPISISRARGSYFVRGR